jgi:O-methyltransferase
MKKFKGILRLLKSKNYEIIRFNIMRQISKQIFPQYRFKWPQLDWWKNNSFNIYLKQFNELQGMNTDRRWMLSQLMRLTDKVPGDTAECGIYMGSSSYIICKNNKINTSYNRTHFGFDSFEGLSQPSNIDGTFWKKGDLACGLDKVNENLAIFDNFTLLSGWIPSRFKDVQSRTFSFVHIDVDIYNPTLDSIKFFYPRMNEGGIILCDDYGTTSCPGATEAIDQFLTDKPEKMISLCCGGGFFIKGINISKSYEI